MSFILTDAGEELLFDHFAGERSQPPDTFHVGIYNDAVDDVRGEDTIAAITTEPNYDGPEQVTWPGDFATEEVDGLYLVDVAAPIQFDITNADSRVDGYYVAADFRSNRLNQVTQTRNLVWTGVLASDDGGAYDLGDDPNDVFPVEGVRLGGQTPL